MHIKYAGQSIEVVEVRPHWQDPDKNIELPVAKTTFVKSRKVWKVYWMRQDLKWHSYEPDPEVDSLEDFLAVLETDEFCCFWG